MSTTPSHPPVHGYEGENPYDLVDSKWGRIERWRAVALSTGELGAMTVLNKQIQSDAIATIDDITAREAAVSSREQACDERERAHAVTVARFVDFVGKASALFDRIQKARADAEREQEDPITLPPGTSPGELSKWPEPSLGVEGDAIPGKAPGDPSKALEDDTHIPSGELHVIVAKDPEQEGLRLKYPVSLDQAEFPEDPKLPRPPVDPQLPSVELENED